MPLEPHTNNEFLGPSSYGRYKTEVKGSLKQHQTSKLAKHKVVSCHKDQYPEFQDKFEIEHPFVLPELNGEMLMQMKHSGDQRKHMIRSKASKDDELVKYMSNLPGYLQRMGRGEKHQEKALNFGVLDWERLEKWKHKQMCTPARNSMNASSSCNSSSGFTTVGSSSCLGNVDGEILGHQNKHQTSLGSDPDPSHVGSLPNSIKPKRGMVIDGQDYEPGLQNLDSQQKLCRTSNSFGNYSPAIMIEKEKWKDLDQRITSESGTSSSNSTNNGIACCSKKKVSSCNGETKNRMDELRDVDFEFPSPYCPDKHRNIVLLLPRDLPQNSCSELSRTSEPRSLVDKKTTNVSRKSFSEAFCPRMVHHTEIYSEVSHSCPLPCRPETKVQGTELPSSGANQTAIDLKDNKPHVQSESKYMHKTKAKVSNSTVIETAKRLDREFADMKTAKGRASSPNRWFGTGLGRMSRSFSLKESSAVPQLTPTFVTVKSGPVNSEASASPDESNGEKAHAHTRGRSSPLRRLLDPLLKPKAAHIHSADTEPLEGKLSSVSSKPSGVTSIVHALLQLTVKNGFPLFKFVVDENDSDILATTVKKLTVSGKDGLSWIYTFYSVRETKKKKSGGWINQGSKGKSCGYAYNVVGQMKVSRSKDENLVKESVLFGGVEQEHANHEMSDSAPNRELAAIVTNNAICNGEGCDRHRDLTEKGLAGCERFPEGRCFCTFEGNSFNNTTVILSDSIHGLPNEGAPSPLINRWKSGGSCDCGGWDIGCKLRVLTSHNAGNKVLGLAKTFTNRFDLFVQGGIRDKRPVFSLVPVKSGIYSVKFNASISRLQAFSICIAVMKGEKSPDISGTSHLSEARRFQESTSAALHRTSPAIITQGDSPVRYVPYPPYSPVGRV